MVPGNSTFVRFTVRTGRLLARGALWGLAAALGALSAWIIWLITMGGGGGGVAIWASALVAPGALFSLSVAYQRRRSHADPSRGIYPSSAASDAEQEKTASSPRGTD